MTNYTIVEFINKIEGYKTATKAIHWNGLSNAEHQNSDNFYDSLGIYEDSLVEDASFTYGRLDQFQIDPVQFSFNTLESLIRSVIEDVILFRSEIAGVNDPHDFGILSLTDDFIHVVNQAGFRSQLS